MAIEETADIAASFQINLCAALCTILGSLVIFSEKLLHLASPRVMAVLLSVSGGITLFQSLVLLFGNSVYEFAGAFADPDVDDQTSSSSMESANTESESDTVMGKAWLTSTGCFGAGIVLNYLMDLLVQKLTPGQRQSAFARMHAGDTFQASMDLEIENGLPELKSPVHVLQTRHHVHMDEATKEKLQRMGVLNAIAIAIHNMPEGIATFVASTEHTYVGLALAIGVGLHNISEGIAVAAPVYFATGSRWRGAAWCAMASVAQHLGGALAFAIMGKDADDFSQGILYGLVSGMLTCISIKDIIPTAHMYANGRMHLVSSGSLIGMFIMSASLIFFKYIGV